jgi:hypothetical protein
VGVVRPVTVAGSCGYGGRVTAYDQAAAPERGPCARDVCGHPEKPAHVHGHDGWKTHCGTCGPAGCPSYRPPGRAPCGRCGVRANVHVSLGYGSTILAAYDAGMCPMWQRPAPVWARAFAYLLGARP